MLYSVAPPTSSNPQRNAADTALSSLAGGCIGAVCGGATDVAPWWYNVSREPHACPPPLQRAVHSVWLCKGKRSPDQTIKARDTLQAW